ncbi:MAG: SWIM zinc finger family protein, partial [Planococcus sp. (in: firmicutes)]|nr:SWIM zinc finger family protein [Planococcus sp. (in: firmicutes)]
SGTQDYEVSVNLRKDGTIVGSYCTCPFESDSLCKHEIAVCLAISEYKAVNGTTAVNVMAQLKALKKAKLLEILEELVEKQPAVHQYLTEKFLDTGEMDEEKARQLIRISAYRAVRNGFIEWGRTGQALEGVEEVLEFLDGLDSRQDAEQIIRLSLVVIRECTAMLQIADDSSGEISSAIYESLEKIDEALGEWPGEVDEATIDRMLELLYPHILFGLEQDITDAAIDLLEAVLQWNEKGNFAGKFYEFIENVIASKEMQNRPFAYTEERFRAYQLWVLQQQGEQKAIDAFCAKFHEYPAIRRAQMWRALEAGEFEKVIQLCEESERLDAKLPGLVHEWKKMRFKAYEKMGNTAEMIDLTFEFVLSGEEEYYLKLKNLVDAENWPKVQEKLLAEMKNSWRSLPLYLGILIEEKRTDELLDYCRSEVAAIEQLYPHLLADYTHEVNEIYTAYIYRHIDRSSTRKAYWTACQKIKSFKNALGTQAAYRLVEEIKFMYPKRPALLDELGKVKLK